MRRPNRPKLCQQKRRGRSWTSPSSGLPSRREDRDTLTQSPSSMMHGQTLRRMRRYPKRQLSVDLEILVLRGAGQIRGEELFQGIHRIGFPHTIRPAAIGAGQIEQRLETLRQLPTFDHWLQFLENLVP